MKVTDDSFQQDVLNATGPVLVDFWAEWCGPCKQIAPTLDDLAKEYAGKLTVAKINIDENPLTPTRYGVRAGGREPGGARRDHRSWSRVNAAAGTRNITKVVPLVRAAIAPLAAAQAIHPGCGLRRLRQ